MKLINKKEEVIKYVLWLVNKEGAEVVNYYECIGTEKYKDTISIYFEISFGLARKKIRISDHTRQHKDAVCQKSLDSITVSKKTSFLDIEKFVRNRVKAVRKGSINAAFEYISKCA